jgi:hypothetical protein
MFTYQNQAAVTYGLWVHANHFVHHTVCPFAINVNGQKDVSSFLLTLTTCFSLSLHPQSLFNLSDLQPKPNDGKNRTFKTTVQ